jgi:hypothetical protein
VSTYSYFIQNFLLPTLATLAAGALAIPLGVRKRSWKPVGIALLISLAAFGTSWFIIRNGTPDDHPLILAGTVVDESSDNPIGQAIVSLVDENSQELARELAEDNGNFRLDLTGKFKGSSVRIHVAKSGYAPADRRADLPAEGLKIQLHRL